MDALAPDTSYFVPAHLERAGAFNPNGNNGYNIEHLRNFHNAAPHIAFGFESMPGHQAEGQRGSYSPNAVGGGTYGGTGVYAGQVGGVWDALLGEGREWFFFASSDYHNRGAFGPDQRETTADFFPGEYTRDYVAVKTNKNGNNHDRGKNKDRGPSYDPEGIVDGLRSGDSYVANGGLIDRLAFVACEISKNNKNSPYEDQIAKAADDGESFSQANCATMGQTLTVKRGSKVAVISVLRDPEGKNFSPYSFANPSLKQIGITQPLDKPELDHVDLIRGNVTGKIDPSDTEHYAGLLGSAAATNASTVIAATYNKTNWKSQKGGWKRFSYTVQPDADLYVRLRGTNLPAATPYETDSKGNPLLDFGADKKIPCSDAACPNHMVKDDSGAKTSSYDVAAWADLWFYGNPIFIRVKK